MPDALDSFERPYNPVDDNKGWFEAMSLRYPRLAKAILGNEGSAKSGPVRPPFQLGFSVKEGKLRFTLYSVEASRTYFGTIDDPSEPLASAERCLEGDAGEWSTKPSNASGKKF